MKTRVLKRLCVIGSMIILPLLTAEEEKDTDSSPVVELDPFVVTGEKFARDWKNTLASISLLGGNNLNRDSISDFESAFRLIPNVRDADFIDGGILIRGINSEGIGGPSGSPMATLYIDGIPQTQNGMRRGASSMWDVKHLEILRGPQSVLSGRNALAGTIRIKTNDPEFTAGGAIRVGVSNKSGKEAALMLTGPLSDNWAFRITGEFSNQEGDVSYPNYADMPKLEERAEADYEQYRGKLLYQSSEKDGLRALITFSHSYNSPAYNDVDGPSAEVAYTDRVWGLQSVPVFVEARSTELDQLGIDISKPLTENWTLQSISGYTETVTKRPSVDLSSVGEIKAKEFSQELLLTYDGENLESTLGVFYLNNDNDTWRDQQRPWETYQRQSRGYTDTKNISVFGETRWEFAENWKLVLGGRFDSEDSKFESLTQNVENGVISNTNSGSTDSDFGEFLPKLGVIHTISETDTLSFVVQKAHRAGGSAINNVTNQSYQYDPESAWNYELSWKGNTENNLFYGFNVFLLDWKDQQINVPQIPGDFTSDIILNAGSSRVYGFELEAGFNPIDGLRISGGIGYAKTEFREFAFVQFGSLLDLAGESFPQAPDFNASLAVHYSLGDGFFIGGDVNYTDSALSRSLLEGGLRNEMPSYTLVNLRAGWSSRRWDIVIYADNVTDKDYFVYHYDTPGFQLATMDETASYGVRTTFKF